MESLFKAGQKIQYKSQEVLIKKMVSGDQDFGVDYLIEFTDGTEALIPVKEFDENYRREETEKKQREKEELIKRLNEKFKKLITIKDLKFFLKELAGYDLSLYLKRRSYWCFDFTEYPYNPNKVHYLVDDGKSSGVCTIKYLYRYLRIR